MPLGIFLKKVGMVCNVLYNFVPDMEKRPSAILEGLNSEQKKAVSCVDGPVLIVAGAGSGKTRVLTSRIAYILEGGCDPSRILALTFTKKAASEMKERIALMVGEKKARRLYMGTFHSVFIRFLREFAESLGYPQTFTIYDTGDSVSAIKTCIKELQLDDKVYKPKEVLGRISMAKNNLVTPAAYRRNATALQNDASSKKPRIVDIYDLYVHKCKQAGVMDFDDILLNMNVLLRDNPAALESIGGRFDYIMVDEYQDTNFSQYLILKKLSQFNPKNNLCVVGDDSQSIYAFRGAKIENILNFKKDYPQHNIFRLEQNYRSTRVIVDAANSLIAKNSARIPKECYSMGEEGEKIRLIKAYTEQEEAHLVATSIVSRIHSDSAQYQDFAILYRTNNQHRVIEEELIKRKLPYIIYSGTSFYDSAVVKDWLAYMKLVLNPNDDESFKRIANKPARGISDNTMSILAAASKELQTTMFKAVYLANLENFGLKPAAIQKVRDFCDIISDFQCNAVICPADKMLEQIDRKFGLYEHYKTQMKKDSKNLDEEDVVADLYNGIKTFVERSKNEIREELQANGIEIKGDDIPEDKLTLLSIGAYLEDISLLSAVDVEDDDVSNKIAMMTMHSSKGLEFPYVYIVGMEENLFPSGGWLASETEVEEERRLCYVAMTRAKKTLSMAFAQSRMRHGKTESNSPSRFIREVDAKYIQNPLTADKEEEKETSFGGGWKKPSSFRPGYSYGQSSRPVVEKRSQESRQSASVMSRPSAPVPVRRPQPVEKRVPDSEFEPTPILQLRAGQRIEHNRFGFGKILEISGEVTDLKARIHFDNHGEKILLLKYAKIRALNVGQ